jgi:hypothetical protein
VTVRRDYLVFPFDPCIVMVMQCDISMRLRLLEGNTCRVRFSKCRYSQPSMIDV